jgi:hypothetical protein
MAGDVSQCAESVDLRVEDELGVIERLWDAQQPQGSVKHEARH